MNTHMWDEIREQPMVLEKTLQQNSAVIQEIASRLRQEPVHAVNLVARGTSDHVGIFTKYLGEYFTGIPFSLAASSLVNLYQRPMNYSSMLTLAISQSGEGPDVLGVVREANRQASLTVGITNREGSALAEAVDHPLFCFAGQEVSVAATKTCTSSMMAAASLIQAWSGRTELEARLCTVPSMTARLIQRFDEIRQLARRFRYVNDCVILARGLNYCAAMETALKIQETCYINARGYSSADLLHGPIAMLNRDFPSLVYAMKGPALESVRETVARLRSMGSEIYLISNEPSLSEGDHNFYLSETDDEVLTPFLTVVFGQMFAYALTLEKGYNPDQPKGLQKITKTW